MRGSLWGAVLISALLWTTSTAAAVAPVYYALPTGYTISNFGVAPDGTGNVWFSAQGPPTSSGAPPVASLGRLNVPSAVPGTSSGMAFFPTPDPPGQNCCATQVRSVAFSRNENRIYFVRSEGVYGYGDAAAMVQGTTLGFTAARLPGLPDLADVAVNPAGGGIWFTERSTTNVPLSPGVYPGARVARWDGSAAPPLEGPNIAVQNGNVLINSPRFDAKPSGIAVTPLGQPWFAEEDPGNAGYRIGTYTGGNSYTEFQPPCDAVSPCSGSYTGTGLRDVAIAPDGGVWFTNELRKRFGRLDPNSQQVQEFALSTVSPTLASGTPRMLTSAPDGTIWMTVYGGLFGSTANAIVRIVPTPGSPAATVYPLGPDDPPLGIAADTQGDIWFGSGHYNPPGLLGRLTGVVGAAPGSSGSTGGSGGTTTPPAQVPLVPVVVGTAKLTPPQVGNGAINTNQVCAGPPQARCSVIYMIHEREYVTGFPGAGVSSHGAASAAKKRKKAPKPRILARKTVTLSGGQSAKVTVKLGKLGKRILKGRGTLKVVFTATQQLSGGKTKVLLKRSLLMRRR